MLNIPAAEARANPPTQVTSSGPSGASGATLRASTKVPIPVETHAATNHAEVRATALPDRSCSSGSRRSSFSPRAMIALSSRGQSSTQPSATASTTHHHENASPREATSGCTAGMPSRQPVSTASPIERMPTTAIRRRGTASLAPISAWATHGPHRAREVLAELADEEDARRRRQGEVRAEVLEQHPPAHQGEDRRERHQHEGPDHDRHAQLAQLAGHLLPVRPQRDDARGDDDDEQADAQRVERPGPGHRRLPRAHRRRKVSRSTA